MTLPLIVILGPTASGKSGYAIRLARLINGEIICADSRTVYRGMDIGTAKPSRAEQELVPHWGLDLVTPDQHFTLYDFQQYALAKIAEIRGRGHVPLLVGGSGLYIDSVIYNYQLTNKGPVDQSRRAKLEAMDVIELKSYAISQGVELPRDTANKRRLIRAIETGGVNKKCSQLTDNTVVVGIMADRTQLRDRSSLRARQMLDDGLVTEVQGLLASYGLVEPLRRNAYGVVRQYLLEHPTGPTDGRNDELVEQLTVADSHLVKKQFTWWRNARRAGDIMWRTLPCLEARLAEWVGRSADDVLASLTNEYKIFKNQQNTPTNS